MLEIHPMAVQEERISPHSHLCTAQKRKPEKAESGPNNKIGQTPKKFFVDIC